MKIYLRTIAVLALLVSFCKADGQDTLKCLQPDQWVSTSLGCLHFYSYSSDSVTENPNLVIVLHGDAPFNKPGYHYSMARKIAGECKNTIAIGLLRPGYTDPDNNTSGGQRGKATGDNYTMENIYALAEAINKLKTKYRARNTILAAHSGGAAISAGLLALKPEVVNKAVLVSCPCDVEKWRQYMSKQQPAVKDWKDSVNSISPVKVVNLIPKNTKIVMLSGEKDEITPINLSQEYYSELRKHGINSKLVQIPDKGHEVFLNEMVLNEIKALIE